MNREMRDYLLVTFIVGGSLAFGVWLMMRGL